MQIDFHHAVTYVLARLAGFLHSEATTIAYAAQYVDNSTNKGVVEFDNGHTYEHIASAHETLDVANHIRNNEDYQVWVPFHFLPGNNGAPAGTISQGALIQRLVCTPDSPLSDDMWSACRATRDTPNALHRLGITAHVYADTFAHQMFAGIRHSVNHVSELEDVEPNYGDVTQRFSGILNVLELGHGSALTKPDMPFLRWRYRNGYGQWQVRDNVDMFLRAASRLFSQFIYYLGKDPQTSIQARDFDVLSDTLRINASPDSNYRHSQWMYVLGRGLFSFPQLTEEELSQLSYTAKGQGSWKWAALGTTSAEDAPHDVFHYEPTFEDSDWKKFHDALKDHQRRILDDVLPSYGLPNSFTAAAKDL